MAISVGKTVLKTRVHRTKETAGEGTEDVPEIVQEEEMRKLLGCYC